MSYQRGQAAEKLARRFLEKNDYLFVASNVKYKFAEIDLIMKAANTYVFVEVKYRSSMKFGGAASAVSYAQQKRLHSAANYYMQKHHIRSYARFDVIAIDGHQLNWIKNAF
jgi:putative endonuclease